MLRGALITPGFVDAHVHATSTGLTLTGLDLTATASLQEALDLLEQRARHRRGRHHPGPWLGRDEMARAAAADATGDRPGATWGSVVYLSRIDVHSAVVSRRWRRTIPGLAGLPDYDETGPLSRQAHHAVREAALELDRCRVSAGRRTG